VKEKEKERERERQRGRERERERARERRYDRDAPKSENKSKSPAQPKHVFGLTKRKQGKKRIRRKEKVSAQIEGRPLRRFFPRDEPWVTFANACRIIKRRRCLWTLLPRSMTSEYKTWDRDPK